MRKEADPVGSVVLQESRTSGRLLRTTCARRRCRDRRFANVVLVPWMGKFAGIVRVAPPPDRWDGFAFDMAHGLVSASDRERSRTGEIQRRAAG